MAKVSYAPLVDNVSGRFGGLVFSQWRGVALIRRFVTPLNPNTTNQQLIRRLFRGANRWWSDMVAAPQLRSTWFTAATGQSYTDRNLFVGDNVALWHGTNRVNASVVGGTRDVVSETPGVVLDVSAPGEIEVDVTPASTGIGNASVLAVGVLFAENAALLTEELPTLHCMENDQTTAATYSATLDGLTAGDVYQTFAYVVYSRTGSLGNVRGAIVVTEATVS